MTRVYVSGPMTGKPDLNFPAFNQAAAVLARAGYDVVNPATLNPDPATPWRDCMRVDIKALVDCDGVATLPGWRDSRGAVLEVHIAERLGLPVMAVDAWIGARVKEA